MGRGQGLNQHKLVPSLARSSSFMGNNCKWASAGYSSNCSTNCEQQGTTTRRIKKELLISQPFLWRAKWDLPCRVKLRLHSCILPCKISQGHSHKSSPDPQSICRRNSKLPIRPQQARECKELVRRSMARVKTAPLFTNLEFDNRLKPPFFHPGNLPSEAV